MGRSLLCYFVILSSIGCGDAKPLDSGIACGEGTQLEDGECVPDDSPDADSDEGTVLDDTAASDVDDDPPADDPPTDDTASTDADADEGSDDTATGPEDDTADPTGTEDSGDVDTAVTDTGIHTPSDSGASDTGVEDTGSDEIIIPMVDLDEDGWSTEAGDCDDLDPATHPMAEETCDGIDNDCDGETDEEVRPTWYLDYDGDGFGDSDFSFEGCTAPSGYILVDGDCDDSNALTYPGAMETCDAIDNNCDGTIDEDVTITVFIDADMDGFGDAGFPVERCELSPGVSATATDCNDSDATVHPEAAEVCDSIDNDCDGATDEDVLSTWYIDYDGDGYGSDFMTWEGCAPLDGYVASSEDCNDIDATVFPGAEEACNGVDDDCDGSTDEDGATGTSTWFADADGDGFGDVATTTSACFMPDGFTDDATDCDDTSPSTHPGADEYCNDVDDDCDGDIDEAGAFDETIWFFDNDLDGYGDPAVTAVSCERPEGYSEYGSDCNDTDSDVFPEAMEYCNDIDDDCDGEIDEDDSVDAPTWYADMDADGFGGSSVTTRACTMPFTYAADSSDCDDLDGYTFPGAPEVCDEEDNDCNGLIDDGAEGVELWYLDADGDGYGSYTDWVEACSAPDGYVLDSSDCDDSDPYIASCGGEESFSFTGSPQPFTVPWGVTTITVYAAGAEGGDGGEASTNGGLGGSVEATINVTPGETLHIYVGGEGNTGGYVIGGGWNGGAGAGSSGGSGVSGSGGGATDIRRAPYDLDNRLVVAGGGGGGAGGSSVAGAGGAGGGLTGGTGTSDRGEYIPAEGGTQTSGGAQGYATWYLSGWGEDGMFGTGGWCHSDGSGCGSGGGGWYGGGGGGFNGGGGGSSYTEPSASSVVHAQGVKYGNGEMTIAW